MKKSSTDFSIPRRQSYVAILLILYKYYKIIIRQLWPFLLIILLGRRGSADYLVYGIIGIALISMTWAIISFFKYYYHIEVDDLVIEKGVLKKTKLSLPISRVQTVNKEQNLIHRLFNVVKLKIDSAGSKESEFELDALSQDQAEELRNIILSKKLNLKKERSNFSASDSMEEMLEEERILTLDPISLLKVGVSENHFRSGALIIAFMFWIFQSLDDVGVEYDEYGEYLPEVGWNMGLYAITFFVIVFFVISFIVSLIRVFFRYYNLSFARIHNGFKVTHGLINRREFAALDKKIQMVSWSDNLLKKAFGIHDLSLKQASSVSVDARKSIRVPGVSSEHLDRVFKFYFPMSIEHNAHFVQVDKRYLYRQLIFSFVFCAIPITVGLIIAKKLIWMGGLILLAYLIISSFKRYDKMGYHISDKLFRIKSGVFGDRHAILEHHKIQSVKLTQTPYQLRVDLANLRLYTASGALVVPYIDKKEAEKLRDYLLYKVESSRKHWM